MIACDQLGRVVPHAGQANHHELRDALDTLLAGKKPPVEVTNPIGCNVKWQDKERHWMPPEACDLA